MAQQTDGQTMAQQTEGQAMAQVAVDHFKPSDNFKIKLVETFNTPATNIQGCDVTTDDTILLTDFLRKKRLIGIDKDGKKLFSIYTAPYHACDVTCIDDTTVAVTSGLNKVISIVDISSRTVKKHIGVGHHCYGVTYRDGTLLVCASGHGILSINLANENLTTIVQCDGLPSYSWIATYKDKLYYTNNITRTVTCCDIKGNAIWTFSDSSALHRAAAITTDYEGRIYVCDDVKNQVIVLYHNGRQCGTFDFKGLHKPNAIHFDKRKHNLIVANETKKVFLLLCVTISDKQY